jgi:putative transposase
MSQPPTMDALCGWFGISRQAHFQLCQRQTQRQAAEATVLAGVQHFRHEHPRLGTRKLWKELPTHLADTSITIGRDRLFDLLGRYDLLVPPLRRGYRTTWAGTWRCANLLAETLVVRPNQAWVSDITYLTTEDGFRYLVLITDVFSRRIMGYDLSASLSIEGLARALAMAVRQVKTRAPGLIFHSDHGSQYTAQAIRDQLDKYQIRSSMGDVGNCYDNALAERINGILKIEYGLDQRFVSEAHAHRSVQQAVYLYNFKRPHLALNYQKPAHFYDQHLRFTFN